MVAACVRDVVEQKKLSFSVLIYYWTHSLLVHVSWVFHLHARRM